MSRLMICRTPSIKRRFGECFSSCEWAGPNERTGPLHGVRLTG